MASERSTWVLSILLIIVIILAAIGVYYSAAILSEVTKTPTPTPTPTTKPTLTVYALWSDSEQHNFQQALGNFTQQTGINVTYYGYTTNDLMVSVPLQLKAPPYSVDVIAAPWPYWIQQLSPYLSPVNSLINVTDYPKNILSPVNSSGNYLAAPFKLSGKPGFWYNKTFFSVNHLSVPTTYTQFKTLLANITAIPGIEQACASGVGADNVGWPLEDEFEGFLMGLGGYNLSLQLQAGPSQRNWTDTQVHNVFNNMTQLMQAGYFSPPASFTSQITKLFQGKYGIYWLGGFITALVTPAQLRDLAFFGFPQTTGVVGAVDYMIIPKYAPHMAQAQQLVQYLAGPEAQTIMVQQGGFLATNKHVSASAYNPVDKTVVDYMGTTGITIVANLDDAIGGKFETTEWSEMVYLWTTVVKGTSNAATQTAINNVLTTLQAAAIQQQG